MADVFAIGSREASGMPRERAAAFHVTLDLDPSADPIAGTFSYGDGTVERFRGWLELMATLERLTADARAVAMQTANSGRTER